MLRIKNLTIKNLKNHVLLEDFSYSLGNEDKVGIIGEEGNGKSTLLKAIHCRRSLEDYMVISGEIDTDIKHMGYFEQQLSAVWNEEYVYAYILKEHVNDEIQMEQYNDLQDYERLCAKLNLNSELLKGDQTIATLSGGEKVKVQLLKLLGRKIDLLLLDEPTNDLDIDTLKWLEGFINTLEIPVLFISHDETLLNRTANMIIHLEQLNKQTKCRHTIFRGNYNQYVEQRGSKLTKDIQIARKEKQEYVKKKIKLNDIHNAVHDALNDTVRNPGKAALLMKKMANIKAQEKRFDKEGFSKVDSVEESIHVFFEKTSSHDSKRILALDLPSLNIDGHVLVRDLHMLVKGTQKAVIIGKNGTGKSLLIKHIYNELKERTDIKLGYMPQNYQDAFQANDTPVSFLLEEGDQKDVTKARELLGSMKFIREEMLHPLLELSEGQKAKLYLLKFIKSKCNVLLLDEPTRNLSPLSNPMIRNILVQFDGCILAVSHDRNFMRQVCDECYEIRDQRFFHKEEGWKDEFE